MAYPKTTNPIFMYLPLLKRLPITLFCLLLCRLLTAQSIPVGELVITGYNTTADPDQSNFAGEFSFLLLTSVETGQVLSFTDRGWSSSGGFITGEGTLTLTFDAFYPCSAEFRVYQEENSWKVEVLSEAGNPAVSEAGNFSLSSAGDQIFVYNGNTEPTLANQEAFVTALQFAGAWQSEAAGPVESTQASIFTDNPGTDFVTDPHFDNGKYNCLINAGPIVDLRANIYNLSNWGFDNVIPFDLGTPCPFFCQGVCTAPNIEGVSTNETDNVFCPGEKITFSIDGNLNDASLWSLYSGSCNGEQLTTSISNSIEWTATKSGTFYIGGLGGCVTSPTCMAINIIVEGGPMAVCKDISINLGENFTPADLDGGSSDNCAEFTRSLDIDSLACQSIGDNTIVLFIEGAGGLKDSCQAVVTVLGADEDCDGVADECDECPGGNDKIDNNQNNVPDCREAMPLEDIIETWRCGPLLDSVFVCNIVNGDLNAAQTECRVPDEVKEILNAGGYLGPCGNTPCGAITSTANLRKPLALRVFPNPAVKRVTVEIPGLAGVHGQLKLYNSFGQIIIETAIGPNWPGSLSWDLEDLTAGIYLLTFENHRTIITQKKLVITKQRP